MKNTNQSPSEGIAQKRHLELHVILSNGEPAQTRRLRFEFNRAETAPLRLWLVKLPRLKNHDAFPRQLTADSWELLLEAQADTQQVEITDYTKEQARVWLRRIYGPQVGVGMTELLIMADRKQFTVVFMEI